MTSKRFVVGTIVIIGFINFLFVCIHSLNAHSMLQVILGAGITSCIFTCAVHVVLDLYNKMAQSTLDLTQNNKAGRSSQSMTLKAFDFSAHQEEHERRRAIQIAQAEAYLKDAFTIEEEACS